MLRERPLPDSRGQSGQGVWGGWFTSSTDPTPGVEGPTGPPRDPHGVSSETVGGGGLSPMEEPEKRATERQAARVRVMGLGRTTEAGGDCGTKSESLPSETNGQEMGKREASR